MLLPLILHAVSGCQENLITGHNPTIVEQGCGIFNVVRCSYQNISIDQNGGAICLLNTNSELYIEFSSFTNIVTTDRFGACVFSLCSKIQVSGCYVSICRSKRSVFSHCLSSQPSHTYDCTQLSVFGRPDYTSEAITVEDLVTSLSNINITHITTDSKSVSIQCSGTREISMKFSNIADCYVTEGALMVLTMSSNPKGTGELEYIQFFNNGIADHLPLIIASNMNILRLSNCIFDRNTDTDAFKIESDYLEIVGNCFLSIEEYSATHPVYDRTCNHIQYELTEIWGDNTKFLVASVVPPPRTGYISQGGMSTYTVNTLTHSGEPPHSSLSTSEEAPMSQILQIGSYSVDALMFSLCLAGVGLVIFSAAFFVGVKIWSKKYKRLAAEEIE